MVRELGRGGCGRTVLLRDDCIGEHFVCKKFEPNDPALNDDLFQGFVNEIKLMYRVYHPNLVRVFGYHLLPEVKVGYIVMEYVAGRDIDTYISENPGSLPSIFRQVVSAFKYMGEQRMLHRDIRPQNILVSDDGLVKVIDLGFGKRVAKPQDFSKSITLNWAFTPPQDFLAGRYDFSSEVYFVGKLFQAIIDRNSLSDDKIQSVVRGMISDSSSGRYANFSDVSRALSASSFSEDLFGLEDLDTYRLFASQLHSYLGMLNVKAEYRSDPQVVLGRLQRAYRFCMLEIDVDGAEIARCFIDGNFRAYRQNKIDVSLLRGFASLFERLDSPRRLIVLANLYSRFDSIQRYDDDEIPF
jgi:serine/threonine-protein kinase